MAKIDPITVPLEGLGNVQAAIDAGRNTAKATDRVIPVEEGEDDVLPLLVLNREERAELPADLMRELDERRPAPRRRKGQAVFDELDSFLHHVNRFKNEHSAIFAMGNTTPPSLVCVLNYHPADGVAWGDHRSVYEATLSERWQVWTQASGRLFAHEAFADFLDDRTDDIFEHDDLPTKLELIEMASNLRVHTKGTFAKTYDRTTGAYDLVCKQEHTEESTTIHPLFAIAIPVFEGGALHRIDARLRLRMQDGVPRLGFELVRASEVLRVAFQEVRDQAAEATGLPVLSGTPE